MNRGPHMELRLGRAASSEANDMASIYAEAFDFDTPKLARILYRELDPINMIADVLRVQLRGHSQNCRFMAVFDDSHGNQQGSSMSKSNMS